MFRIFLRCILFWILFELLLFATGKLAWFAPSGLVRWTHAGLSILSALTLIFLFLRDEKKTFATIGLKPERKTMIRFTTGLLIGSLIMAFMLVLLLGFSELTISRTAISDTPATIAGAYLLIIAFAFMEELVFRSYTLVKLDQQYGLWPAQFISALVFALYHVVTGWSWYVAFMGPFMWAFIFALSATCSGGIAMPTGIHASLNILQVILGMKASEGAFFVLKLKEGHSHSAQQNLDRIGVAAHIGFFIIGLAATWLVQKKRRSAAVKK